MDHPIHLKPFITLQRKTRGQPPQLQLRQLPNDNWRTPVIAAIAMTPQQLHLIGSFRIEHDDEQECTVVYLSQSEIAVGTTSYRLAYIPSSKVDQEVFACFSDIFRELADIVISDINSAGVHKLKEKQSIDNKHFVLSGERDIYQVSLKENSLQLAKSMEVPFLNGLKQQPCNQVGLKATDAGVLMQILGQYMKNWQWFLLSQKSWSLLSSFVVEHYKCKLKLNTRVSYTLMQQGQKMLTKGELSDIRAELLSIKPSAPAAAIFQNVLQTTMKEIEQMNQKNASKLVAELKQQILNLNIASLQHLQTTRKELVVQLADYSLDSALVDAILLPKQLQMNHQIIQAKDQLINQLQATISTLQQTIHSKNKTIDQYHQQLEIQQQKLSAYHQLETTKCQLEELLHNQTLRNEQLTLQLTSSHLLERKSLQAKVQLQNKIMEQKHEKEGLLQCLHQLTQQNLSLLNQKEELQNTIKELKDNLEQTNQIQVRALRCIENEAEIKTRLYRYQKYVSELKLSIRSFKKLQSEKFNYILAKNYEEFQQLQKKYNQALASLKREEKHSRMLNESLQRERIRLNYFEKLLTSNYQHQPIPQCSEENSQTDRQIPPIPVE